MRTDKIPAKDDFEKVAKPIVGNRYHLAWAYRGARWELAEIYDDQTCLMVATKNGRKLRAQISDLRELR